MAFLENPIIRCDHCASIFNDNFSYKKHLQEIHERDKLFRCGLCNTFYAQRDLLLKHLRATHWDMKHQCPRCTMKFADKDRLNQHLQLKHNIYYCKDCKEVFLSQKHDCIANKNSFTCDLIPCNGKPFKLYSFYVKHLRKIHNIKKGEETEGKITLEENNKLILSPGTTCTNGGSPTKTEDDSTAVSNSGGDGQHSLSAQITPVKLSGCSPKSYTPITKTLPSSPSTPAVLIELTLESPDVRYCISIFSKKRKAKKTHEIEEPEGVGEDT